MAPNPAIPAPRSETASNQRPAVRVGRGMPPWRASSRAYDADARGGNDGPPSRAGSWTLPRLVSGILLGEARRCLPECLVKLLRVGE